MRRGGTLMARGYAVCDSAIGFRSSSSRISPGCGLGNSSAVVIDALDIVSASFGAAFLCFMLSPNGVWERKRKQEALMAAETTSSGDTPRNVVIVRETGKGKFQQEVRSGRHHLTADEPTNVGGLDSGPGPYDLLLAALGACTSMTLRLYADQKKLPLKRVEVRLRHDRIYAADCAECETKQGLLDHIERVISLEGDLDAKQRARLMEIADMCPVHKTLTSEVRIHTVEWPGS
jgi:uncharacterized OsmC-like protein